MFCGEDTQNIILKKKSYTVPMMFQKYQYFGVS